MFGLFKTNKTKKCSDDIIGKYLDAHPLYKAFDKELQNLDAWKFTSYSSDCIIHKNKMVMFYASTFCAVYSTSGSGLTVEQIKIIGSDSCPKEVRDRWINLKELLVAHLLFNIKE